MFSILLSIFRKAMYEEKFVKLTIAPGVSIGWSWETDYIYLAGKGHCDKFKSALKECQVE